MVPWQTWYPGLALALHLQKWSQTLELPTPMLIPLLAKSNLYLPIPPRESLSSSAPPRWSYRKCRTAAQVSRSTLSLTSSGGAGPSSFKLSSRVSFSNHIIISVGLGEKKEYGAPKKKKKLHPSFGPIICTFCPLGKESKLCHSNIFRRRKLSLALFL